MTQLSYAAAGVSIDNGDELVDRIKPAASMCSRQIAPAASCC